jgi:hypothetical protein
MYAPAEALQKLGIPYAVHTANIINKFAKVTGVQLIAQPPMHHPCCQLWAVSHAGPRVHDVTITVGLAARLPGIPTA